MSNPADDEEKKEPVASEDVEMKDSESDKAIEPLQNEIDETEKDPEPDDDLRSRVDLIVGTSLSTGNISDGIESLLAIEKKQRQAEDEANTLYIARSILTICHSKKDWKMLSEQITVISRRRSQFRRVIIRIVQMAMEWIDEAPSNEIKLGLIDSLLAVTEGKIFVEVEKARLTRKLAGMKEAEGKISEAAEILQELQIETYGSMKKAEKCEFLLEQVRLCLAKRDFIRAGIIRNKITSKILEGLVDLEIQYWNLSLIYFYHFERQWLELSKAYRRLKELFAMDPDEIKAKKDEQARKEAEAGSSKPSIIKSTPGADSEAAAADSGDKMDVDDDKKGGGDDEEKKEDDDGAESSVVVMSEAEKERKKEKRIEDQIQALSNSVFALVLAPYDNEQFDLLNRILVSERKLLEMIPVLKELLRLLTTHEIIAWPLPPSMHDHLCGFTFVGVVDKDQNFEEILHDRIIQHNIRTVARYYRRITTSRLGHFLGVSEDETERYVSEMVTKGTLYARIDRLDGIIRFRKKETPQSILNDWRDNIDKLLSLVDESCHQIHKEMVIHEAKKKAGKGKKSKKGKGKKKKKKATPASGAAAAEVSNA